MIKVQSLSKSFGGVKAVDACSLEIKPSSITGLIGPNGAGKTTLFNIIAGNIRPDKGKVFLGNEDITGLNAHQCFYKGLCRSFQIAQEFSHLTVLENLMVVPLQQTGENLISVWFRRGKIIQEERKIYDRAMEVLQHVRLDPLAQQLAGNLSGGQKKLLELARIMMAKPKIVLLDEIAAGINRSLLKEITREVRRLNTEGLTFFMIEHDMDLISELCDSVIVMAEGRVLTQGNMHDIRKDQRVIESYLGAAL